MSPPPPQFPAPFQVLFAPKRYKVLYGGRGGAKSWNVARALLLLGRSRKLKILCARELQKSIDESVHELLDQQIGILGLQDFYRVERQKIYGANGTEFGFEGIKNNVNSVRSYEGVDICWIEEAVSVSKNSWKVLIPTIRKEGSEIWMTFNPNDEDDYTYSRFVKDEEMLEVDGAKRFPAPIRCPIRESASTIAVKVSWKDNPWFPSVLRDELENDKKKDYDNYLHVWEGFCIQNLDGAVYAKELRRATLERRICSVPYEREVPVDTFWDLGRADNTAIWFAQRVGMQWRLLDYYEECDEDITHYLKVCQDRGYLYGTMFLPHDAKHKRLGYKNSIEDQVRNKGYSVRVLPAMNRADGINMVRQVFSNCWFDEEKCREGLHALRNYAYKLVDGKRSNDPLHNWASDGADAFRYFAMAHRLPRDETPKAERLLGKLKPLAAEWLQDVAGLGWMR